MASATETTQEMLRSVRNIDLSDDNLADMFIEGLGTDDGMRGKLRFVPSWKKWLHWNGQVWQPDEKLHSQVLMQGFLRRFAARLFKLRYESLTSPKGAYFAADDASQAEKAYKRQKAKSKAIGSVAILKSNTKMSSVLKQVAPRKNVAASVDLWDADPLLLNTPTGIVDLETGSMRKHNAKYHMTKLTAVGPSNETPTKWLDFLKWATGGDDELQSYLQRVCGYCLTGTTNAQTLFFGHGSGGNGKSVFINTIDYMLGDYSKTTPSETFLTTARSRHPTELANLQGARFVTASEIDKGARWNESRITSLTGNDKIAARFMFQDFFEYVPQFKLFIIGNHKPSLASVNEAIRRRMQLIPFTQKIDARKRDDFLSSKIRDEAGSILTWAIEGYLQYRESGLRPPRAVLAATDDYLDGQDPFAEWLEDNCELGANYTATSGELFESWAAFAARTNERVGSRAQFATALSEHTVGAGLERAVERRDGVNTRVFRGIQLLESTADVVVPFGKGRKKTA